MSRFLGHSAGSLGPLGVAAQGSGPQKFLLQIPRQFAEGSGLFIGLGLEQGEVLSPRPRTLKIGPHALRPPGPVGAPRRHHGRRPLACLTYSVVHGFTSPGDKIGGRSPPRLSAFPHPPGCPTPRPSRSPRDTVRDSPREGNRKRRAKYRSLWP